jgi:hypothetical protein
VGDLACGSGETGELEMTHLHRKIVAEFVGTAILVFFGVGSAVFGIDKIGAPGVAVAFGLTLLALAYGIGPVSGCHINPAITLGVLIRKGMPKEEAYVYWAAQFAGALFGAALIKLMVSGFGDVTDQTGIEPFGDRSVVADDRPAELGQQRGGLSRGKFLVIRGVVEQRDRQSRPLLPERLTAHRNRRGSIGEGPLLVRYARVNATERLPVVHAVVHERPSELTGCARSHVRPAGQLNDRDGAGNIVFAPQSRDAVEQLPVLLFVPTARVPVDRPLMRQLHFPHVRRDLHDIEPAPRSRTARRQIEDAMPAPGHFRHELLRALVAKRPVEDRETDDVERRGLWDPASLHGL